MKKLVTSELEENNQELCNNIEEVENISNDENSGKTRNITEITSENETVIIEKKARTRASRRRTIKDVNIEEINSEPKKAPKKKQKKNPFVFSLNTEQSLLEISATEDIYEIYSNKEEYVLFLGKNSSYFSSAQDNLFLESKNSNISISKVDNVYKISTNLDVEISDNVSIANFGKNGDLITFSTADSFKVSAKAKKLYITNEVYNKNKFLTNLAIPNSSNNCLIISDEDKKVYLPYSFEDVDKKFKRYPDKYDSITDLIENEYILPATYYKNPIAARFREGYRLMRRRQRASIPASLALAVELAFESHLHPAIITACKNLEELDIYLDCLDDNELDKFSCFEIIYKSLPVVLATQEK